MRGSNCHPRTSQRLIPSVARPAPAASSNAGHRAETASPGRLVQPKIANAAPSASTPSVGPSQIEKPWSCSRGKVRNAAEMANSGLTMEPNAVSEQTYPIPPFRPKACQTVARGSGCGVSPISLPRQPKRKRRRGSKGIAHQSRSAHQGHEQKGNRPAEEKPAGGGSKSTGFPEGLMM